MIFHKVLVSAALASFVLALSCGDEDDTGGTSFKSSIKMSFSGLPPLAEGYLYEGWAIVDDKPISTGTFNISEDGAVVNADGEAIEDGKFNVSEDISNSSSIVISIEPNPDDDPAPAPTHIVSGDVDDKKASLTVDHSASLASNFSDASGSFVLKTPTDGDASADSVNERSGVWFLDALPPTGPGLTLPTLPSGWKYEGWVVVDGTPFSTGTFVDPAKADDAAPYSGTTSDGPPFPGEDFVENAPEGATFPLETRGGKVVVSIEPDPDDSKAPFAFKPLVADIATDATSGPVYELTNEAANNTVNVTGSVEIE